MDAPAIEPVTRSGQRVTSLGVNVKMAAVPLIVPLTRPPPLHAVFAYVIVHVPLSVDPLCVKVTRVVPVVQPTIGAAVSVANPLQFPASWGIAGAGGAAGAAGLWPLHAETTNNRSRQQRRIMAFLSAAAGRVTDGPLASQGKASWWSLH